MVGICEVPHSLVERNQTKVGLKPFSRITVYDELEKEIRPRWD